MCAVLGAQLRWMSDLNMAFWVDGGAVWCGGIPRNLVAPCFVLPWVDYDKYRLQNHIHDASAEYLRGKLWGVTAEAEISLERIKVIALIRIIFIMCM